MSQSVVLIDDDESFSDTIALMLERDDFTVTRARDGRTGLDRVLTMKPDIVLIDLRLPGLSGMEVCKRLRSSNLKTPIIVLSGIGDEIDKVLLLEIGADDYLVKPFGLRELLARIRAVLRRTTPETPKTISFGDTEVDLERRAIRRAGRELKFTPSEYKLLTYFLENADRVLTRDMILNSVWGYDSFPNTRTVDVHVVKLRQKLEEDPNVPRHFVTVHGVGYRFLP